MLFIMVLIEIQANINNQFYLFLFLSNELNLFGLKREFDKKIKQKNWVMRVYL